jgi:hypothetical protein
MRHVLAALACVIAVSGVSAQTTSVLPSAAQRCLTRGELLLGTPTYPQAALEAKASGRVSLELEFTAPDVGPELLRLNVDRVDRREHADQFERSVREFIKAYRVPCLSTGEKSKLTQEFVFLPHDRRGVTMMASSDQSFGRGERLRGCLRHQDPKAQPLYPSSDLRAERQGTVVVRLEFTAADAAPTVTVLDNGGGARFADVSREHALGYRMPCHDGAGSASLLTLYTFKIEGSSRVTLKDVSLPTLVAAFRGIRNANVYFDFDAMGCPFEVLFRPMQPHAPNDVGVVGEVNEERRFFLDWLSRQQLDLPAKQVNALLGQEARVSVPCMLLNLSATSGGGGSQ